MRYARLEAVYERIRALVFATPGLSELVSRRRASRVERSYARLCSHYAARALPKEPVEELLRRRGGPRLQALRAQASPPRILYVGTDHAQDTAGILQGLDKVGEVVPFTRPDGSYGQAGGRPTLSYDLAVPNGARVLELLESSAAAGKPFDVVVGQMWDQYIDRSALDRAREHHGVVIVNISMDDRHTYLLRKLGRVHGTRGMIPSIDLAATSAPEVVGWYLKEECPAIFFPEASDPNLFRPRPDLPKLYDVCFVGLRYGIRSRIVDRLRGAGIAVEARGRGWERGRVPVEELPRLFAQSKIVLGVGTIGHSERLLALKMRDFDGPMSGSCYVTTKNPDLDLVYRVGEEIAVYEDETECVDVVQRLLADDDLREEIGRRGRMRAERDHTWAERFRSLMELLTGRGELHGSAAGPPRTAVSTR